MDGPDHVQPADHRVAVRVRPLPGPHHRGRSGSATLVWIRFRRFPPILAAHEARLARERYFSKQKFADPEATIRRARPATQPAPPALTPSAARAHRDPPVRGRAPAPGRPAGSVGLTGQVIHSDGRGVDRRARVRARTRRIEPHTNPNTTWFIVVEGGGWVGVGDERTRIAAGEAVALAGRRDPRGVDRALARCARSWSSSPGRTTGGAVISRPGARAGAGRPRGVEPGDGALAGAATGPRAARAADGEPAWILPRPSALAASTAPSWLEDPRRGAPDGRPVDRVGAVPERPARGSCARPSGSGRPGRNAATGGSTIRATSSGEATRLGPALREREHRRHARSR